jgi:outer membrane protein assembly factor BamB
MNEPAKDASPAPAADFLDLIFLGTKGYVAAIHKFRGSEAWRTSLEGSGFSLVTLLLEDGVLYAASHGYLYALNPASGEVFWRNDLKGLGHNLISMTTARNNTGEHSNPTLQQAVANQARAASSGATPGV